VALSLPGCPVLSYRRFTLASVKTERRDEQEGCDSAPAAEAAAREVLQIFFDVFGYRGQWRLEVERHRGERADHDPVYTSVTPDDFAKAAARAGYQARVTNRGDTRVVALTHGRREFPGVHGLARTPGRVSIRWSPCRRT
jgi:hypothetical protein